MTSLSRFYRIAFLATVAFYALFFARFGFENWDTGFVQSQSWRVANGEQAFRDFWSIRPPVTAYFHGFFVWVLPDYAQVYLLRVIGYLLFALQVFFVVDGVDRLFFLRRYKIDKWGAMLVCFVMATGKIYPDPWFTVDGILFASAAFYILARVQKANVFTFIAVALLAVLSAGCKQSFYFVPVFFSIWIALRFGWKKAVLFVVSAAAFVFAIGSCFVSIASFSNIMSQISGTGNSRDFLELGLLCYLNAFQTKFVWVGLLALSFCFAAFNSGKRFPDVGSVLKWLAIATFLSALAAIPIFGFNTASTILLVAVSVAFFRKTHFQMNRIAKYFPIAVLTGIAWCAGLSKGFPFPVLFAHALALSFFVLMFDDFGTYRIKRLYLFLSVPIGILLVVGNFSRYRETGFLDLDCNLSAVSPKLAGVVASAETSEKLQEVKMLREKYGQPYVVAPSLPQVYYLFGDRNPLPADWLTTFELKNASGTFLRATPALAKFLFLERSFVSGEPFLNPKDDKNEFSLYANYVLKHGKPVEKTRHFLVYDTSGLHNVFPKYPIKTNAYAE
ncbi:hypothetical protein [Flavobacterium selenitireducens]|uniref:hypothetical protein n=1 Tax=Flavobacterium selenitireducens TaxID=2722704 RepID=UPI00168B7AAF|nr:hypothetical protein [Flavobacterium selenitireducens]MBD3582672.1 hypothetical protein [Flavobacterium selenitireducens]